MKQLIVVTGLMISGVAFGAGDPSLKEEIIEQLIIDLSSVELNADGEDYVVANFTICDGQIEVVEIRGTQQQLIRLVKEKLNTIEVYRNYVEDEVYRFRFTFEKN